MKKDMVGNEIQIGDYVIHTGGAYKGLSFGRIVKITAKQLVVASPHQRYGDTLKIDQCVKVSRNQISESYLKEIDDKITKILKENSNAYQEFVSMIKLESQEKELNELSQKVS